MPDERSAFPVGDNLVLLLPWVYTADPYVCDAIVGGVSRQLQRGELPTQLPPGVSLEYVEPVSPGWRAFEEELRGWQRYCAVARATGYGLALLVLLWLLWLCLG